MEIEAITRAFHWVAGNLPHAPHISILTDSGSTLERINKGFLRTEWMQSVSATEVSAITWVFCPGHAGIKGNEEADRLAGEAMAMDDIHLDKSEALSLLHKKFEQQGEEELHGHHSIGRMKEMGVKRGDGRKSKLAGKTRRWRNQETTGTISIHSLQENLRRGSEQIWVNPSCNEVVPTDK